MKQKKESTYILVVDIGNTSTSVGLYRNEKVSKQFQVPTADMDTLSIMERFESEYAGKRFKAAVLCSVAPKLNHIWQMAIKKLYDRLPLLWVDHTVELGVEIAYPKPASIGPDRLATVSGAVYRYGAPVIVMDFGTAVTFDVVSTSRTYLGGVIAPGLPLMFSYLHEKTALLPYIKPGHVRHDIG